MSNMHWYSIVGFILIVLGTILSFWGTILDNKKSKNELTLKLKDKDIEIAELETKVTKTERGIVSIVQFDGSYLLKQGGSTIINGNTKENKIFKEIVRLDKVKDVEGIILLCDSSIKSFPEWYTPYYFKAVALLNQNPLNRDNAVKLLEEIAENTLGDPQYILPICEVFSKLGEFEKEKYYRKTVPNELIDNFMNPPRIKNQKNKKQK